MFNAFPSHVLTCDGPLVTHIDNAQESFGGDTWTQVIGTIICALAQESQALTAVRLFCRFLMPFLFGESSSLADTLQAQLMKQQSYKVSSMKGRLVGAIISLLGQ